MGETLSGHLLVAVAQGTLAECEQAFAEHDPPIRKPPHSAYGELALVAVRRADMDILRWVLKKGFPADKQPRNRPLIAAVVQTGPLALMMTELLLEHGANPGRLDGGEIPIMVAAAKGTAETMEALRDAGADIHDHGPHSDQSLVHACIRRDDNPAPLALVLSWGQKTDARLSDGLTPLHIAAADNAVECARLLLDNGAEVDTRETMDFQSALITASGLAFARQAPEAKGLAMIELLLAHGAQVDVRDHMGATAFLAAAERAPISAMERLLAAGSDLRAVTKNEDTALHRAAIGGRAQNVRWLLEQGLDPSARNTYDRKPEHLAIERSELECQAVLRDARQARELEAAVPRAPGPKTGRL